MADTNYVDDLYEMDCPKFVDFNVPQDMNDNADEWFNFDHENGIPIKFDDEKPVCRSDDKEEATESSSEEMSIDKSDEDSASAQESSSGVEMLRCGPEEPKTASSCGDVTSSEMSADSLDSLSVDVMESRTVEKSTRQHRSIGREQKRSHVKKPVTEAAPKPTVRISPRLHVRRSADAVRTKRSSTSQATKRRSANPGLSHQYGRPSPMDPSIRKRRKMGNESMISPTGKKTSCPKMKPKLTLATTPTLLKHNFAKPIPAKSTEELEMEKIEHFRQKLAAKRKQSQQSYKAVKESVPHLPVRSTTKNTKAEAFKFETDSRIKSHPMETRNDARTPNFTGNLRKYSPLVHGNHGLTKPKEFHLSDNKRKRTHDESTTGEKKGHEFRSMALAITQFQTRTPKRFHTKPLTEQNKGPEPAVDKPKRTRLTHPRTPALESRSRHRPVTCASQSQREEQEVADMKSYKFKARPVDPRVYYDVSIGIKTATHKEPTKPEGFDFETDKRLMQREASRAHTEEEHYEFRARPLPVKMLAGPVGIADAKPQPITLPQSPAFALKNRMKIYEEKEKEKEKESELDNSHLIRARPVNRVGAPFIPTIQHKKTEVEPFSFDDKIRAAKARKEAKLQELLQEEENARKFQAQPLPDASCSGLPGKRVKPPTQAAPFTVAEKGAKQAEEWRKKMEEEVRECKRLANAFKAKPANVLYEEPFIPEKSDKPMTDISNFNLNTERRAEERKEFEQRKYDRQCDMEDALAQREAEKQEEMRNEINKMRAEAVHKANPIRQYRTVEVLPSTKPLTQPKTPKFSDRTRHTVSNV